MTDARARAAAVEVILKGLRAYAPDEMEVYGRDEAEMIADYVVPYVADAVAQAVKERDTAMQAMANAQLALNQEIEQQAEEIARLKREIKNLLYGGRGNG